jgi:hypothetical protein
MAAVPLLSFVQQAAAAGAANAQAAPAAQPAPSQLEREIQGAIRDAQQAARAAAQDAARGARGTHTQSNGPVIVGIPTPPAPPTMPGMIGHDPFDNSNLIPPQAVDIAMGFFLMCAVMVVGWPISRALGRRLERRGETPAAIPATLTEQLQRIEQAVDAMSIEVERISESQRFMARLQSQSSAERMALPSER